MRPELQIMGGAQDWLSDPPHSCKPDFAFDIAAIPNGRSDMPTAEKCCALGALMKFASLTGKDPNGIEYLLARNQLCNVLADEMNSWASITTYNDTIADHDALLKLYKLAIKRREEWEAKNGEEKTHPANCRCLECKHSANDAGNDGQDLPF